MFYYTRTLGIYLMLHSFWCALEIYANSVCRGDTTIPLNSLILFIYFTIFFWKHKIAWYLGLIFNFTYFLLLFSALILDYRMPGREAFTFTWYYTMFFMSPLTKMNIYVLYIPVFYSILFFISFFTKDAKKFYGIIEN